MHLVTHGHFWSRDKGGGHTIQSVIAENTMLHSNFMAVCFIEPELLPMEVSHCENDSIAGIEMTDHFGCCDLDLKFTCV